MYLLPDLLGWPEDTTPTSVMLSPLLFVAESLRDLLVGVVTVVPWFIGAVLDGSIADWANWTDAANRASSPATGLIERAQRIAINAASASSSIDPSEIGRAVWDALMNNARAIGNSAADGGSRSGALMSHAANASIAVSEAATQFIRLLALVSSAFVSGVTQVPSLIMQSTTAMAQLQSLGWMLLLFVMFCLLVAAKLLIGINLMQFATQRYGQLRQRQEEEERRTANDASKKLGDKDWADLQADVAEPKEDAVAKKNKNGISLDTIERYTLFKNRIP
ncbi:hypothetical protein GQ42DRAFT_156583 [Ramicandelaber brevisporus]|nr:hypothetical protein GQ42DRAFT_156583 [Ramicandelaber brevisporus]